MRVTLKIHAHHGCTDCERNAIKVTLRMKCTSLPIVLNVKQPGTDFKEKFQDMLRALYSPFPFPIQKKPLSAAGEERLTLRQVLFPVLTHEQ